MMIGSTFSHYEIVRKLGEGGMGEVFLAEDLKLQRKVAVKFLATEIAHNPRALARFDREAKAVAAMSHPNIITVHETGVHEGRPYIVMTYVEGQTVAQRLKKERLAVPQALDIACQVCEGLVAAHARGIIHRDIKPANIHIDESRLVRILDFGVAKEVDATAITDKGYIVGTIRYMSPEQALGHHIDARSDVFSLGVVLYEMLTGRHPFESPQPAGVYNSILQGSPPGIRTMNPAVRESLACVVEKAIARDPGARYATARDMLVALRRASRAEERVNRSTARRHRTAATAIAAALILALGAWFVSRLPAREPSQSVAVLPFENLSGDAQQQFFADGMTDAITTRLAQLSDLLVISKTSAMRYEKSREPIRQIASELGVRTIVEGSVTRQGEQARITAQLIDAQTDRHLWAHDYMVRDVTDVIALQSRIATDIAQQVSAHVKPDEKKSADDRHPDAWKLYVQGRALFNRRMPADITAALEYFNQAIAVDSTFAEAYAGIADCYIVRAMWNWDTSQNTFPRARYASERALQIDPMLAEAHAARAMVQLYYDWDWKAAEASFKTAIGLKPSYATAYHWYGLSLMSLGKYHDAIRRMERAVRLDPFSPIMLVALSQCYDLDGQYDKASAALERAFAVFPDFGYAWLAKSWVAYHQKQYAEAANYARIAMRQNVDRSEVMLVAGLDGIGERAKADTALAAAAARPGQEWHVRAALYAYHGMPDSAVVNTERAIAGREWFLVAFRSRWLEPMHGYKPFDELLKKRAPIKGID